MDFSKISVLVMDGGGKQTLTMIHGLKDLGARVTVLCNDKSDACYVSNKPDAKILEPALSKRDEEALQLLIKLAASGEYDVLMPVGERSTDFVTEHEDELKKHVRLACAPRSAYINAFDKQRTFELAGQLGVPAPETRRQKESVEAFLERVAFPLIIKPRKGLGSVGFHKFEKREDFEPYLTEKGIDIDEYVLQEFVEHEKRLGVILFMDQEQNVCMSYADEVLRWFPLDAGSACLIKSIDYPEIVQWSADLLKAMAWQGVAALSFMVDQQSGQPKLLEINGRIPQSIRLSSQCGFNVAKLLVEMAMDEKVEPYPPNTKFGLYTRQFDLDLAWFLKSPSRFKAKPSWFSWKNTKDATYYKDDKKPFRRMFMHKLTQYREIMKRKRH